MSLLKPRAKAVIPLAALCDLRREGWSCGRLARHFGTSTTAVYVKLQRHAPELCGRIKGVRGQCAICERLQWLMADHDHATNRARGLLCTRCNLGLGTFADDEQLLRRAADYLSAFSR